MAVGVVATALESLTPEGFAEAAFALQYASASLPGAIIVGTVGLATYYFGW